jgi:hypothetical protein
VEQVGKKKMKKEKKIVIALVSKISVKCFLLEQEKTHISKL